MRFWTRVLFIALVLSAGLFVGVYAQTPQVEVKQGQSFHGFAMDRVNILAKDGEKIPGIFLYPKEQGKRPVIFLLHGYTEKKDGWLAMYGAPKGELLTQKLLENGYAVFAIDLRFHGERRNGLKPDQMVVKVWDEYHTFSANMMDDIKISLDYLENHPSVSKIGMLGYSLGGMLTFDAVNREPRIQTAVICVSPPILVLREYETSSLTYHNLKSTPWLMLMARNDPYYKVSQAEELYNTMPASEKKIVLYDSGHALPLEYMDETLNWFKKYLAP